MCIDVCRVDVMVSFHFVDIPPYIIGAHIFCDWTCYVDYLLVLCFITAHYICSTTIYIVTIIVIVSAGYRW